MKQAASIPEGQNELKRNQLRELAALNGTLRDDENQACQNCGFSTVAMTLTNATQVGKLDIANMIVLNSGISLPISSVVPAETLAIWLETALIGSVVLTGAMMAQVCLLDVHLLVA